MTPQQANELLPCPFCASADVEGKQFDESPNSDFVICNSCGVCAQRADCDGADPFEVWNRRAPAPTEPAVDRDAGRSAFEREMMRLDIIDDEGFAKRSNGEYVDDVTEAAWGAWKAALATPASPAVPVADCGPNPVTWEPADVARLDAALSKMYGAPAVPEPALHMLKADPTAMVALALSGALPDAQAGEILSAAYSPQVAQASQWKWPRFEDWLASPITPPINQVEYVRLAFNAGREQASQPTSAEELQQKEHIPPFAEPASQHESIAGAVARGWCAPENASKVMDEALAFAIIREVEAVLNSRCRAQGGITNDSKGLPTSAEGKDSDNQSQEKLQ